MPDTAEEQCRILREALGHLEAALRLLDAATFVPLHVATAIDLARAKVSEQLSLRRI